MLSSNSIAPEFKANIVFRVDGGRSIGMGHIVRCLSLATVLRQVHGCSVSFRMNRDDVGIPVVEGRGWSVLRIAADEAMLGSEDPAVDGLIIDLPNGVSAEFVRKQRASNTETVIVLMDGTCSGRLESDLVVSPIERLPQASAWADFRGERYEGPMYAILDAAYAHLPKRSYVSRRLPHILVTMGGSDPHALTLQALRALDNMPESFQIVIALGPAFIHEAELAAWCRTARHEHEIRRDTSLLNTMVNADLAIVSFGTTVYELAATGLPAVALSITKDHAEAAEIFARNGSLISLGLFSVTKDAAIQSAVRSLLSDPARRFAMAQRGQETVDGNGAQRVAELLLSKIYRKCRSRAEGKIGKSQRV